MIATFIPASLAAFIIGLLVAAVVSVVVLVAAPRGVQLSAFGAALGISADNAYASLSDQTPVNLAHALVKVATGLMEAVGIVGTSVGVTPAFVPYAVWSFIGGVVVIMGLSFLIKHDA